MKFRFEPAYFAIGILGALAFVGVRSLVNAQALKTGTPGNDVRAGDHFLIIGGGLKPLRMKAIDVNPPQGEGTENLITAVIDDPTAGGRTDKTTITADKVVSRVA